MLIYQSSSCTVFLADPVVAVPPSSSKVTMMMRQKVAEVMELFRRVVVGERKLKGELHSRGSEVADSNHWQRRDNMRLGCCHTQSKSSQCGSGAEAGWVRPKEPVCLLLEALQAARMRQLHTIRLVERSWQAPGSWWLFL